MRPLFNKVRPPARHWINIRAWPVRRIHRLNTKSTTTDPGIGFHDAFASRPGSEPFDRCHQWDCLPATRGEAEGISNPSASTAPGEGKKATRHGVQLGEVVHCRGAQRIPARRD